MSKPTGLPCLLLLLLAAAVAHAELPGDEAGEPKLTPGDRGIALTVLEGSQTLEIPVRFIGTYDDFAGPGYDLHLVELEGPDAEEVGVAAGMSGSPVYFDGKLIGALAYRLGFLPKKPVAGVTPIADMRAAARADEPAAPASASGISPIATPITVAGMLPEAQAWLEPQMEALGFVLGAGGKSVSDTPPELRPGSPVGVQLMRGDMSIAATGTVTWVEGDRIYAFGHPFMGSGRVEMPMVSAEVIHTLADLAGSVKLSSVGAELGAIVEDRRSAVIGRLGLKARMIPMELEVTGGDYTDENFHFELVKNSRLSPMLAGVAVINSLRANLGYTEESTMLARGRVRLRDLPDLPLEMAFAGPASADPIFSIATDLFAVLSSLQENPFAELQIEGLELSVEARPGISAYAIEDLHYDRGALQPGETLKVRCVLRQFRGETTVREIDLELPDKLPPKTRLILAVGSPDGIDRALGNPLAQRFQSARDLASMVGVLADRRSAHRLTAVVYEQGKALVSRGASYADLPPTVQRLLSTQAPPAGRRQRRLVSTLTQAELELDGPVTGVRQVVLRVARTEEEK